MNTAGMLRDMFKGPAGSYDTARILFAIGGLFGIVAPVVFQAWAISKGQNWDPLAFCTAYGAELAAILSLGGFGIATKDKGVASALNTTPPSPPEGGQP
jgi:hypothetical protein